MHQAGPWRKSRLSGTGDCVEWRFVGNDDVEIRNSRAPDGPILSFTRSEWMAFVDGIRTGESDLS